MTDLEQQYPELLERFTKVNMSINSRSNLSDTSNRTSGETLDLAAWMKASGAIASEIELDKLLTTLMKILLESCGAETGYLILESQGQLRVEASCEANSNQVVVLQSTPIETGLPLSIIRYVATTQEKLMETNVPVKADLLKMLISKHSSQSLSFAPLFSIKGN
jgi:transcriptional regulator with GAF, ATPase, and Fis domain